MMYKSIAFIGTAIFSLTVLVSPCFSIQDDPSKGNDPHTISGTAPSSPKIALNEGEVILVQSPQARQMTSDKLRSYFVQAGGALPIYDEDFRDFVDHGASITLGVKKEITSKLSLLPTIGMLLLNGDWSMENERESVFGGSGIYYPGYPDVTDEEGLPDENMGVGYSAGGEVNILNAELLQHIDLETSLYILPLTLNLVYRLHEEGVKKINPYIGGGMGLCVAWREVESRTLKERYYEGPQYRLTFNDNQTVTGQVLQLFGGIEVPFNGNMKFVANIATALYDLKQFDPIVEISASKTMPSWYEGPTPTTFSYENSFEIGEFREEFVTSASIGVVVPF